MQKHKVSLENKKVLEIGCGEGTFMSELAKFDADVEGIELSDEAVRFCTSKGFKARKLDITNEELPWKSHFDIVITTEVIEHVFDHYSFVARINNLLNDNGFLFITTPNFRHYKWLKRYLKGETPTEIQNPTHIRFFTKDSLQRLLEKQGFEIIDICSYYEDKWFWRLRKVGFKTLANYLAAIYGHTLVVLAKKTNEPAYNNLDEYFVEYHSQFRKSANKES